MSEVGLVTVSLEITRTYSNSKALRPWTSGQHDTHGTRVFQNLMYKVMYIFIFRWHTGDNHQSQRSDLRGGPGGNHRGSFRKRNALPMTDTELRIIAAAAIIGLSRMPKNGYITPAAMGTPTAL